MVRQVFSVLLLIGIAWNASLLHHKVLLIHLDRLTDNLGRSLHRPNTYLCLSCIRGVYGRLKSKVVYCNYPYQEYGFCILYFNHRGHMYSNPLCNLFGLQFKIEQSVLCVIFSTF